MDHHQGDGAVYSIVIPIYNEESVIPLLLHRLDCLLGRLDGAAEIIIVDDGSKDTSSIVLAAKCQSDPRYRLIRLSRNFGHQLAITAGLDAASGQAVIVMDGDLQDPPEVIETMISRWREGYQIVYARRRRREGESASKRWSAKLFYSLLGRLSSVDIPFDVGDFRLVDRVALAAFRAMREQDRFVRGMFAWIGFRQSVVEFERPPRAAGVSKYPLWKMIRLAVAGLVGFSDAPLLLAIWVGAIVSLGGLAYGLYVVGAAIAGAHLIAGWASTIVVVTLLGGMNMLLTGIIGLYIARIYTEAKARPLYVVAEALGFDSSALLEQSDQFGADFGRTSRRQRSGAPISGGVARGSLPLSTIARAVEADKAHSIEMRRPA